MLRRAPRVWLFALVFQGLAAICLAPAATGAAAARLDAHSGLACASCHLDGERATPETARRLTTTQVRICSRCH